MLGQPIARLLDLVGREPGAAGQRFIKSLSRPNRKGDYPVLTEAVLRRVVEYNRSDLRALEALYGALAGDLNEPTP